MSAAGAQKMVISDSEKSAGIEKLVGNVVGMNNTCNYPLFCVFVVVVPASLVFVGCARKKLPTAKKNDCAQRRGTARIAATIFVLCLSIRGPAMSGEPAKRPLLLAHYMPWFASKPVSGQWGWHWTMNAFDPERITDGKRQIASHYYPLIGPYDSGDPSVIEYHLLLMKLAGIDGIMVDWYGLSDLYDYPVVHRNTQALVASASKLGLKVGICYEDQTITKLVEAKRLAVANRVAQASRDLHWLSVNWFASPAYLKYKDKPVLLSFGRDGLNDAEWKQALHSLDSAPIYLSEHTRRSAADGTFDWPQPSSGVAGSETYYQTTKEQTIFMPVAFPRFHDIYKQAGVQAGFPQIPDEQGRTFAMTLARGLQSGAAFVQIATWNDWGEGTHIEASEEFGYRDLETIQKLRRAHDPRFTATPADLRLPYRLWWLRRRSEQTPQSKANLDAVARLLASGNIGAARSALRSLEASSQQAN